MDLAGPAAGVEAEVVLLSLLSLDLAVDVLHVIGGKALTFVGVEVLGSLGDNFLHTVVGLLSSLLVAFVMRYSQELVIGIIDVEL